MITIFMVCAGLGGALMVCQFLAGLLGLGGDHGDAGGHDVGHDFGHDAGHVGSHDAGHHDQGHDRDEHPPPRAQAAPPGKGTHSLMVRRARGPRPTS